MTLLRTLSGAVVLLVAGAGCPRGEVPGPGAGDGVAGSREVPPPPRTGPAAWLPHPGVGGFAMARPAETYGPGELERLVNGGADLYRRHGFRAAAAAEYSAPARPDVALRIELFDMGSPLGAFGYLSAGIAELADPATAEAPGVPELGEAGTIAPGALTFHRGDLLVRLVYQDLSTEATEESLEAGTRELLPEVARSLARALPGDSAPPAELAGLPAEGRVRRSEQLHPERLLGLDALGPGVSALYGDPGPRYRVGVGLGLDEARARAAFESLRSSVEAPQPVSELGDEALSGTLAGGRSVLLARGGAVLAVALAERSGRDPRASAVRATVAAALSAPSGAGTPAPVVP